MTSQNSDPSLAPAASRLGQAVKLWQRALRILSSGRFYQSGLPWLRKRGLPLPMSLQAYAFDRYKRERLKRIPYHRLSELCWPSRSGLVSIILPVYNGAEFLTEALDSILAQAYPGWELIAIDDGSTDESGTILDRYAGQEPRMQVIHQPNRKLPGALSRGFQLAQGEYLTWTSCDNRLYPDFLSRLVDCLERHPNWDMTYANIDLIDEAGQPLQNSTWYRGDQVPLDSEHIHLPKDPSEINTLPDNTIGSAFLYRRRVSGLLGNYSPYWYTVEDYDYWLRVNALLNLKHADFDAPIYAYRFHSESLTNRKEELEIDRRQERLVIYDGFRRDFYLSPLMWMIEAGPGLFAAQLAGRLRQLAVSSNHLLLNRGQEEFCCLPHLWFPVVYVHIVENPELLPEPPAGLPNNVLKVLATTGSLADLSTGQSGWNFYIATGAMTNHLAGWVIAPDEATLFSTLDIWTRSWHMAIFEREMAQPPPPTVKVSVVICSYKRLQSLEAAIISVAHQEFPARDFELLVVNNDAGSTGIQSLIDKLRGEHFKDSSARLRLVQCPVIGLSHARNAGISEARGQVVCFLDDDAIADRKWLTWIWQAFEGHPKVGVVGGKIILKTPSPPPRWLRPGWRVYWSHFIPPDAGFTIVKTWDAFPFGANWCARRQALLETGGFRTFGFGRQGGKIRDGEEIALASLIQQSGYEIGVEPRAEVLHDVEPERFTLGFVWRKVFSGRWQWYQSQLDLYLPNEIGLRYAARRLRMAFQPLSLYTIVKVPYAILAEARTLVWYLADLLRRFRKPAALE
jgi:glycosyltransferase involved in cell wall biosynthesis